MSKVANQRSIVVSKERCDRESEYVTINLKALDSMVNNNLSAGAIKLWLFFSRNQDGSEVDMWQDDLDKFGLPKSTYKRAWKELEEKGYLVLVSDKTRYVFYEKPIKGVSTKRN